MSLIEIRDLRFVRDGRSVLNVGNLSFERGERVSLVGPNGAGKSTLFHSILRLHKFSEGSILYNGVDSRIFPLHRYRQKFSIIFQEPLLLSTSVYNNVATGLKIRGVKRSEIKERVEAELDRFRILHLSKRDARSLSGGEAQRVNLARAFVLRPEVLFLDEPFSSLDISARESLVELLEQVLDQSDVTAVMATHDRMDALRLTERVIVMKSGEIVQDGAVTDVFSAPVDEFTASFAGKESVIRGRVSSKLEGSFVVTFDGGDVEVAGNAEPGEMATLFINPENIVVSNEYVRKSSERNRFRGTIKKIIPMGFYYKLVIDCNFSIVSYITTHSLKEMNLSEGDSVAVSFKATSVHAIVKGRGII